MQPIPQKLSDDLILKSKTGEVDYRSLIKLHPDDDLKSSPASFPGRPRTFLLQPELKTAPFSCELILYDNNIFTGLIKPVSRFLRCGAGVKVILDNYIKPSAAHPNFEWKFALSRNHPDFKNLSLEQKEHLHHDTSIRDIYEPDVVIQVNDSMEEETQLTYSIEESWAAFVRASVTGQKVLVDLSQLRPNGTINSKGLMASGPIGLGKNEEEEACSFFDVYKTLFNYLSSPTVQGLLILLGTLNDTLRRGGFKRGIVTSSMSWKNRHFNEYLDVPLVSLPGGHKKGARLDPKVVKDYPLLKKIVHSCNVESLFLAKIDPTGYDNVCMGLKIVNFGTCLIHRFNIGAVEKMRHIPGWMNQVAAQLTLLHLNWRRDKPEIAKLVAPQEQDLQIGMDIMGMANALAYWKISYREFVDALHRYNDGQIPIGGELKEGAGRADQLVFYLAQGYQQSTDECDRICDLYRTPRFLRIHTPSEPAQSHSYETKDLSGFATARAIFAPPCSTTRNGCRIRRVSNHQKNVMANHGFIENAADIGPELHEELCAAFTKFVGLNGRSHGYMSFDDRREMTEERLIDFILNSDLQTKYYSEHKNFNQYYLNKKAPTLTSACDISAYDASKEECAVCAE